MTSQEKSICEKAMTLCDVLPFRGRWFQELSGGEKQRVLLASALAQSPKVLLLDEPTLSLDLSHQVSLFQLIRKLHHEESLTVVVATHELNLAARFLNRLLLMKEGRVMADGASQKVLTISRVRSVLNIEVEKVWHRGRFPVYVPKTREILS